MNRLWRENCLDSKQCEESLYISMFAYKSLGFDGDNVYKNLCNEVTTDLVIFGQKNLKKTMSNLGCGFGLLAASKFVLFIDDSDDECKCWVPSWQLGSFSVFQSSASIAI